jgi:hypothetical protein
MGSWSHSCKEATRSDPATPMFGEGLTTHKYKRLLQTVTKGQNIHSVVRPKVNENKIFVESPKVMKQLLRRELS